MFDWSDEKDAELRAERGISFQEIVFHIEQGDIITTIKHPNPKKYPKQEIMYIRVDDYVYLVPYVESSEGLFLKTIIPSRKATKKYLGGNTDET